MMTLHMIRTLHQKVITRLLFLGHMNLQEGVMWSSCVRRLYDK